MLLHEYPLTWGQISKDLRNSFVGSDGTPDFEQGMSAIYEAHMTDKYPDLSDLLKDMGRYFSHFRVRRPHNNQYHKLIARFRDEMLAGKIVLATLNYDCLIEYAASHARSPFVYWDELGSGLRLLKLHGSCNFILPGISGQGKIIIKGALGGSLTAVDPLRVDEILDNSPAPPAMSLYNLAKTDLVCPEQILKMREMYASHVRDAMLVIVVGVRPRLSGDDHVWKPLIQLEGDLGLVCSHDEESQWRRAFRTERDDPSLPANFQDAFDRICSLVESALD